MKIKAAAIVFFLVLIIVSGVAVTPDLPLVSSKKPEASVSPASLNLSDTELNNDVLSVRFLNMLNHNLVYGDDFLYIDEIVNLSAAALCKSASKENPDFLEESTVFSYIGNMYGIEITDTCGLNPDFPHMDGYVYIIPRGYAVYKHSNPHIVPNEDGTFTVTTSVEISEPGCDTETFTAVSLFRENKNSSFGYNLISSDIIEDSLQM